MGRQPAAAGRTPQPIGSPAWRPALPPAGQRLGSPAPPAPRPNPCRRLYGTTPALLAAITPLEANKQRLSEATQGALTSLKTNLRSELLRYSLLGSLRVLIGAAIFSAFLYTIIG